MLTSVEMHWSPRKRSLASPKTNANHRLHCRCWHLDVEALLQSCCAVFLRVKYINAHGGLLKSKYQGGC